MKKEIIAEFTVKIENVTIDPQNPVIMICFYSPGGGYIGDIDCFKTIVEDRGIVPEKSNGGNSVCSIGKSHRDGKWYGWSHRAMWGFQIGDTVKEGDCCASSGWTEDYLKEHPEEDISLPVGFVAKTEEDCKRMAIAFAESVS